MRAPPREPLTPTILMVLDSATQPLATHHTRALADRSAPAARLSTSIDAQRREAELPALFRAAVERVTRLPSRTIVHREGYEIRDAIVVALAWTLGSAHPTAGELRRIVETVVRLISDFYSGTQVDLHAVVLLPDLLEERDARYALAYEQLAFLETTVGPGAPRLDGRPLFANRWLCDCRTLSGAHAGRAEDVMEPVAQFLATLAVGPAQRVLDEAYRDVLFGASNDRITGYSAPGYAEIVYRPEVFARLQACTLGAELLHEASCPLSDSATADRVEACADEALATLGLESAAKGLLPPVPDAAPSYELRRSRRRTAMAARQAAALLDHLRRAGDRLGFAAAAVTARALLDPLPETALGAVRPCRTVADLEFEARIALRQALGIDEMRARAAPMRAGKEAPAPEESEDVTETADPVAEAADQEVEAERLEALLASGDLDAIEAALVDALGGDLPPAPPADPVLDEPERHGVASEAAPDGMAAEPTVEPEAAGGASARRSRSELDALEEHVLSTLLPGMSTRSSWRPRGWGPRLRTLFNSSRVPPPPPNPSQPVEPESSRAPSATPNSTDRPVPRALLVEWLRFLSDFRKAVEESVVSPMTGIDDDLRVSTDYYRRQVKELRQRVCVDRPFSHRLLSREQCDTLFRARREELLRTLAASGHASLSRYLESGTPTGEPLDHPVNHRFDGFDDALNAATEAVFADYCARGVEEAMLADESVGRDSRPTDRLRALADAGHPLLRPEGLAVSAARVDVLMLPGDPESSGVPPIYETISGSAREKPASRVHYHGTDDRTRISLRTALHGFPAFALGQLRPVRSQFRRAAADDVALDPFPDRVLVDDECTEVTALAIALGLLARTDNRIGGAGVPGFVDEAELADYFARTFDGQAAYAALRDQMAEMLIRDRSHVVRQIGATLRVPEIVTARQRTALERLRDVVEGGGWPDSLPLGDHDPALLVDDA